MTAPMLQQLATAAGAVTAVALNALWEDALLVVCVWLLLRAWPGLNAATRYMVWSATLIATVVVPVATTLPFLTSSSPTAAMTGTAVRVPMPMVTHALTAAPTVRSENVTESKEIVAREDAPARQTAAAMARLPERFRITLPLPLVLTVLALWALLAAVSFVRLAIGLVRLERLKRDALPLPIEYREAMARWTEVNKGSRQVRLCVSDDIDVPVAVGLFDSMILIPRALLDKLSEAEVDQISLHELAHLRRADDWSNGLQRVAIALFAWNPGVLFVGQQLDLEREVACDDWVLALTGLVRPYAMCLTKMAETSAWPHRPMPAPGVFATRKHISLRVERLLGAGRNAATNLSLGPAAATVAIVAALAFAMQLVAPSVAAVVDPIQPVAVKPATTKKTVERFVRFEPSPKPVAPFAQPAKPLAKPAPAPATKQIIRYERVVANQTTPATTLPAPSASPGAARVMHVPETHVHVPGQTIAIPSIDVDIPAIEVPMAGISVLKKVELRERVMQSMHVAASASARAALGAMAVAGAANVKSCMSCDMSGVNLAGRDMQNVKYVGVDLSRAKLQGTNFSGGTFSGVDFSGADLRNASFRNAHLTGCDFTKADLSNVDFTGASITGCDFTNAQLPSAQLRAVLNTCTGCDFTHANLSGQNLSGVRTTGIDFSHANLSGANLSGAQFSGVDFSGAQFNGANLTNTVFTGCDMGGVDLSHVDLSKAKFVGTDLTSHGNPHP
ncbi:MAG TPA: pentapeptide repeat-containing protein [Candidatus Tumulicola sp.]